MTASTVIPFALTGTGQGVQQDITINGSPLTFVAEGHRAFGGTDSAPSPLDYVLGALISCTQVTSQIIASQDRAIKLGKWEIGLKAHLDNAVLVHGAKGISNFRDVNLTIAIETNLTGGDFQEFADEVERRCPLTQLFRGSGVEFSSHWTAKSLSATTKAEQPPA
ncbi:OsmC family protein [Bradyrhizobium sp. KB893862 SZCCT0404]|uniref:OsmC family protein n=1 Tax=Bradyrhizobium sp. KB893862 SZCCT0404 TaxID=2807672 RepID=UPI001BA86748|nr:OsmC family protein [Bradyrhizobium sp. KB893862 SZCCT0404]MBR1177038.1 OsmC family protein [Bradyrhizobium sp. KB893862 SZCCT0404]